MPENGLPEDLLERSPEEAARLLALDLLAAAQAAKARLVDPHVTADGADEPDRDEDALHDFRVALRRLRSTLRAYRPVLEDAVSRKLRRRLGALADSTNAARDAEVQLLWLHRVARDLRGPARRGATWLISGLEAVEESERARGRLRAARRFDKLEAALRRRLQSFRVEYDLARSAPRRTFAACTGGLLAEHAAQLRDDLAAIASLADVGPTHIARIAAKRLRYVLEPWRSYGEGAAPLVERLKSLQDELGDLHDAQVLVETIADTLAEAAAQRARRRVDLTLEQGSASPAVRQAAHAAVPPGLLLIVDLVREGQAVRFAELEAGWLGGKAEEFLRDVEDFGRQLQRH